MNTLRSRFRTLIFLGCGLASVRAQAVVAAGPSPAASAAFDQYAGAVEARLATQRRSAAGFLVPVNDVGPGNRLRLGAGQVSIENLNPRGGSGVGADSMIHHWRATAFAAGASAQGFEGLMRDLPAYSTRFAPQVERASLISQARNSMQTALRLREQHVLTVWMDVNYDVRFGELDTAHHYMDSHSTEVRELSAVGTPKERALPPAEEHGWIWRMNTYWSYVEADGGLYLQVESITLTRSIPGGLGWLAGPYVESIPRESLDFTLRAVCTAIQK